MSIVKLLMTARPIARFRTLIFSATAPSSTFAFTGMQAGDLCVIWIDNRGNGQPTTPAGWNVISPSPNWTTGNNLSIFWKVLSSSDIAAGSVTISGVSSFADVFTIAYAGATSISDLQHAESTTTVTLSGFTKPASCIGLLFQAYDQTHGNTITPTALTGLNTRINGNANSGWTLGLWDLLSPLAYTNGSSLTFSSAGTNSKWAWALSLNA